MSLSAGRVGVRADQVDSHGRVISPSFLNEIMEDLPEWTDLPVRVNGTEQLIPSNPSVPVTSPILADIDYPDERRNAQYFTYRESPTTVDGLAKIKSINGNTLVWNQLARKDSASSYVVNVSAVNANGFITVTGTAGSANRSAYLSCDAIVGHKYLVMANSKIIGSTNTGDIVILGNYTDIGNITSTGYMFVDNVSYDCIRFASGVVDGAVYDQKFIPQVFDLTKMFGAGKEPTTVEEFTSLFPLPYYTYNSGSLLSFNGTAIKTTGKNQFDISRGGNYSVYSDSIGVGLYANNNRLVVICPVIKGKSYTLSFDKTKFKLATVTYTTVNTLSAGSLAYYSDYTIVENTTGVWSFTALHTMNVLVYFAPTGGQSTVSPSDLLGTQLEIGSTATDYEPYEENTTNLPTETYFPTGMKSAGNAYDELTPTKVITRVGAIDLGDISWVYANNCFAGTLPSNLYRYASDTQATSIYSYVGTVPNGTSDMGDKADKTFALFYNSGNTTPRVIYIKDSAYTDATAFKTAMSGVYLYYELATPIELPTLSFE